MADTDTRRDYRDGGGRDRGHGGGGGGGRFNKRKRRDDDDYDQGFRNQRQRQEPPPGTRIRKGLLEIGEDLLRLPHEVAANVAKLAADNYDDEYVKDTFRVASLKLVLEQPFKIPFIAAVVLYANGERSEMAEDLIKHVSQELQGAMDAGRLKDVKLLLRFLACLGPLFEQDGMLAVLDELFDKAADLQTASTEDAVGIELCKIILLTIPYLIAASTDASLPQKVGELLEKTEIIASTAHTLEALVDPYPQQEGQERAMACQSLVSLLQTQLNDEASNGWKLFCIPRVYDASYKVAAVKAENGDGESEMNGEEEVKEPVKHSFPSVTVPSTISAGSKILLPEVYFSLFADQEIESVPTTANIASSLLRDAITDTINILDFNRNAVAKFLNEIDCYWAKDTFVKRSTTFDKLRDLPEGRPTWKPEDVAIDAIFSQIFQLPTPEHRLVYYHSLITESCKISPGAIAPSLGRAIRFLFRNIDQMDMELSYRFMDWFAHHLSNFEFRWKWTEWVPDVELPDLDPKKAFINGVLDKEIRLSFAKRIRATLPEPYHKLIPASKEKDIPDFKFADDQTPYAKEGREVLALLKKKASEDEIQKVLDSVHEQATALGAADPLVASTDIYMTSILSIGSKSLSHVLSTIDRCKERLLSIGQGSESARRQVIGSVVDFWSDHPGTAVNIVDKLLNYTIITPMSVISWALIDRMDRGRALASSQIYEMVSITMFKVTNRVRQVLRERNNTNLDFSSRKQIDEALPNERQAMRDLFAAIEDAVAAVASGAQDEMIERFDGDSAEQQLIRLWGNRWARVWRRKAAVEEAVVGEAVIGALEEPAVIEQPDVMEDFDQVS
ncbi:Putative nuclear cap-binding protein subunit 1 [Septoria linicola]|uniref:Nuclear cap-binding protein subunit 1 n=1 Tax=Septoria linicola TaxID=215465 RepID=A0A9Q9AM18_9PEZI|nr:putative nuclear cap-binding protein subunit 1 [Septoria linicola]USW51470.1 Putative nuclear cap-binding protein subunit 1 [Septoria linicola]